MGYFSALLNEIMCVNPAAHHHVRVFVEFRENIDYEAIADVQVSYSCAMIRSKANPFATDSVVHHARDFTLIGVICVCAHMSKLSSECGRLKQCFGRRSSSRGTL